MKSYFGPEFIEPVHWWDRFVPHAVRTKRGWKPFLNKTVRISWWKGQHERWNWFEVVEVSENGVVATLKGIADPIFSWHHDGSTCTAVWDMVHTIEVLTDDEVLMESVRHRLTTNGDTEEHIGSSFRKETVARWKRTQ